jgi:glucokinase
MVYKEFVLAIDMGGTNTSVGVFGVINRKRFRHIYSFFYDSQKIRNAETFIKGVIDGIYKEQKIKITKCCLSAAGPIDGDVCKLTNADLVIDSRKVMKKTGLRRFSVINDFQAIGYGIEPMELFDRKSFSLIKRGKKVKRTLKAVIGAGTGLGKSFLIYDGHRYVSMPSEGGHEAFSPSGEDEFQLMEFIKRKYHIEQVTFEHLVSGRGLSNIYEFLTKRRTSPEKIASLYQKSPKAKEAFDLFVKFYARAARNYTLDILPYSGVYLAGGIISKNIHIFSRPVFKSEFLSHPNRNHRTILRSIPVYAIKNYDISLYGDAYYLMNFK